MKSRSLWVFFAVMLLSALALAFVYLQPAAPRPTVAIQDGKTIDFSSGRPVVKDDAKQKATIDKAVREMDEAVKDITFTSPTAPTPVSPTPKKAAPKK